MVSREQATASRWLTACGSGRVHDLRAARSVDEAGGSVRETGRRTTLNGGRGLSDLRAAHVGRLRLAVLLGPEQVADLDQQLDVGRLGRAGLLAPLAALLELLDR